MLISVELSKEQIKDAVRNAELNTVIGNAIMRVATTEVGFAFDKREELINLLAEFQKFVKEYSPSNT